MARSQDDGTVTYARPRALPGVEILFARQNSHHWRIFHERYAICTCNTAAADWRYRRRSNFLEDRAFMLMEPGETHFTYRVHKPSDFQVLFLTPEVMEKFSSELALPEIPHLRMSQDSNPEFFQACQGLYAAIGRDATVLEQQSRLAACVRLLLTHYVESRLPSLSTHGTHRAVARAKEYLRAHFDVPVTLDELCAVTGLSRFHLLRTFVKQTGIPPHAYQIRLRIERGRALLQTGLPLSSVALSVGFADQSHFTRHFRQIMGVTPARYANATWHGKSVQ